jgi:hypothetical protein
MVVDPGNQYDDEEIALRPYLETVWRYRRLIALALVAAVLVFAVAALGTVLLAPRERLGILSFRLSFTGAEIGQYPSGARFSPPDIIAAPIVSDVYEANSIDRYATLEEFRQSLAVVRGGPAVRQLDAEYQPQLRNIRLSDNERLRLQHEYLAKRDGIREPQFDLRLHDSDRFQPMPVSLMEKVLSDVLETWAARAGEDTGVTRPPAEQVSRDMFVRAADEGEPYLLRVDAMRRGAQRLVDNLRALQEVPGARTLRTPGDGSLADELATVDEIVRVDVEGLLGLVRFVPVPAELRLKLNALLTNQLFTSRLALREASLRARTLRMVLNDYMALRPASIDLKLPAAPNGAAGDATGPVLGELIAAATAAQVRDFEYRRELTIRLLAESDRVATATRQIDYFHDLLNQLSQAPAAERQAGGDSASARVRPVLEQLLSAVDRTETLNKAIAAQLLSPSGQLYAVSSPFRVEMERTVPAQTVITWLALTILITLIAAVAGSLVHHARATARAQAARPHSAEVPV